MCAAFTTIGQETTINFLNQADSYGAEGAVERIDTHAAIVFLVGSRAYKLKRAVTFPFLDYGTEELRRKACEAELELNRRTAPDLYLEVRSVNRLPDGRLSLDRDGEPVDWLVVMRRFEQDCLFDRLAAEGRLSAQRLRALTDRIVSFHFEAERTPQHGGAMAMRAVIDGNRESMSRVGQLIPSKEADSLHRASIAALAEVQPLLDARRAGGYVKRCHGDLHLRNICLLDDVPTLFDCIEFSEEFACIDVLYDLSFLLMDLSQRGLKAEANLVFNRYLDMTDEAEGLAALPLFLSVRAAVRAHVEAASAVTQISQEARSGREESARGYLALAADLLRPRPRRLIAIGGLSGTGKSTLAYALGPDLGRAPGARVLRSDVIRKRLKCVFPETRLSESDYGPETSALVYDSLCIRAKAALDAGSAVIADAVFAKPAERAAIRNVSGAIGIPFDGLWLEAPLATLEHRLTRRTGDASDATAAVARRQTRYDIGSMDWHRIDASSGAAATCGAATALLSG